MKNILILLFIIIASVGCKKEFSCEKCMPTPSIQYKQRVYVQPGGTLIGENLIYDPPSSRIRLDVITMPDTTTIDSIDVSISLYYNNNGSIQKHTISSAIDLIGAGQINQQRTNNEYLPTSINSAFVYHFQSQKTLSEMVIGLVPEKIIEFECIVNIHHRGIISRGGIKNPYYLYDINKLMPTSFWF